MSDDDIEPAAQSRFADPQVRVVQDYVERGRRLEQTPKQALDAAWIHLMRAQAAVPPQEYDTRLLDIEAEYSLRGIKPPYELLEV